MLILKKTIVPCLSGCGFFVAVGRAGLWMGLWMGGLAFGWAGRVFRFFTPHVHPWFL